MAEIFACDVCGEVKKFSELKDVNIDFDNKDLDTGYQLGLKGRVPMQSQRFQVCLKCRVQLKEMHKFSKVEDYNVQAKV